MAVFDVDTQKLVVRMVYDGPAHAGKTTNVRALCDHFTARRRGELFGADELDGRTLYFDWVQIETGLAGGFPLSVQVVSVPGQTVLAARRRFLVGCADVVVLVCDSARSKLDESRAAVAVLREVVADQTGPVPIVLQANKQDVPDALSPAELLAELDLPASTQSVGARADAGVGVIETFVHAIRSAADRVQRTVDAQIVVRAPERPEEVLEQVRAYEVSDEALLQILSFDDAAVERPPPTPPPPVEREDATPIATSATAISPHLKETIPPRSSPPPDVPALPAFDVATGFIWPPLGRELLREIDPERVVVRDDLVGRHGAADGSGKSDAIVLQAGPFCLKTSTRRCHPDSEQARASLLQLARSKMRLGDWLLPKTVLAVQSDPRGFWLWTVTPWVTTLGAKMNAAAGSGDERALGLELERFARAAVDALVLAARSHVVLDVHPSNFASIDDRLYYLDDDVGNGAAIPTIGHAILRRAEEWARFPDAVRRFGDAVVGAALRQLDERERGELRVAIAETISRAPLAEALRGKITAALGEAARSDAHRAVL